MDKQMYEKELWVIDQTRVQNGWKLASFFLFCEFMDRDGVAVPCAGSKLIKLK